MVRPVHEARARLHERRRSLRHEIRRHIVEKLHEEIRERTIARLIAYGHWLMAHVEMARTIAAMARNRGRLLFTALHFDLHNRETTEIVQVDRWFMEILPPEEREFARIALREIAQSRYISDAIRKHPYVMAWLSRLILRERPFPCRHDAVAVKLTPITIEILRGLRATFYVVRWWYAEAGRADAYLGRSKWTDGYWIFMSWKKPGSEIVNSMSVVGEDSVNPDTIVYIDRDVVHKIAIRRRVIELVLMPHQVRDYAAREAGRPEMMRYFGHCSIYAISWVYSKSWRLKQTMRFYGRRPRRRVKDITYYMGLRF